MKRNLLVEMSVIDGHLWHIAAEFGAFVDELIVSFLRYIVYLDFIKDLIK